METKKRMLSLFGLNLLFYGIDLFILYKRFFDQPQKYTGMLNFTIVYAFAFSLLVMIPTIVSYFILFNFLKNTERDGGEGDMILTTVAGFVCMIISLFYNF